MPDYYLCLTSNLCAVAGPFDSPYAVAGLVDAQANQTMYGTASRYELAKCGKYPRNKQGETALASDVEKSGKYKNSVVICANCGNELKHTMYRGWIHKGYDEHGAIESPMTPTMEICGKPEPAKG